MIVVNQFYQKFRIITSEVKWKVILNNLLTSNAPK